jgi:hypothetical protein
MDADVLLQYEWGPAGREILEHCLAVLKANPDMAVTDLTRFLTDSWYRGGKVVQLRKRQDLQYWEWFERLPASVRTARTAAIVQRLLWLEYGP